MAGVRKVREREFGRETACEGGGSRNAFPPLPIPRLSRFSRARNLLSFKTLATQARKSIDLPTSRALKFFHGREARVVDFLCFLRQKRTRERELTTGTGNEKRRTLRKTRRSRKARKGGLLSLLSRAFIAFSLDHIRELKQQRF